MSVDAEKWLRNWVRDNVRPGESAACKSSVQGDARSCFAAAIGAGLGVAQLKEAAGGDLEIYLMNRKNAVAHQHR
jgi:hypothetical protein